MWILAVFLVAISSMAHGELVVEEFEEKESIALEDLIVTAQKRIQSTQDVAISMAAYDESLMKDLGIEKTWDVASKIPNFDISFAFGNSSPVITMRGLGINDVNSNNNPSAGVYFDEVYLGSTSMLGMALFDTERVEVLMGPQGTLYGRNTTAGAISFYSKMPTEELEGYVKVGAGNYASKSIEAAISGPLVEDKLLARLAINGHKQEGHFKNRTTGDDKVGDADMRAYRATLQFNASDDLTVTASFHQGEDRSEGWPYEHFIPDGGSTGIGFFTGDYVDTDNDPFSVDSNLISPNKLDSKGGYLKFEYVLDDWEFVSVSAVESVDRITADDTDAGPAFIFNQVFTDEIDQVSQEFRGVYSGDNVELILGAFYSRDIVEGLKEVPIGPALAGGISRAIYTDYEQLAKSKSIFAHSEWVLTDSLNFIAGIRYTDEEKEFDVVNNSANFSDENEPLLQERRKLKEDDVSGTVGLQYYPSFMESSMVYGSVSKGFKSGGFDGSTISEPAQADPFVAETVIAYEIGIKSDFLNSTLRWSAAVFVYDYQDMQLNSVTSEGDSVLTNAGKAEIKGLDTTIRWRASTELEFQLALGYIDAELVKYTSDELGGDDLTGNEIPNAPKFSLNGYIRYGKYFEGHEAFAVLGIERMSSMYKTIQNNEHLESDSRTLLNLTLGIAPASEKWDVRLWAKNLTDEEYIVYGYDRTSSLIGDVYPQIYGMPRTVGLDVEFRWE